MNPKTHIANYDMRYAHRRDGIGQQQFSDIGRRSTDLCRGAARTAIFHSQFFKRLCPTVGGERTLDVALSRSFLTSIRMFLKIMGFVPRKYFSPAQFSTTFHPV